MLACSPPTAARARRSAAQWRCKAQRRPRSHRGSSEGSQEALVVLALQSPKDASRCSHSWMHNSRTACHSPMYALSSGSSSGRAVRCESTEARSLSDVDRVLTPSLAQQLAARATSAPNQAATLLELRTRVVRFFPSLQRVRPIRAPVGAACFRVIVQRCHGGHGSRLRRTRYFH